jgi:hypothetical protein
MIPISISPERNAGSSNPVLPIARQGRFWTGFSGGGRQDGRPPPPWCCGVLAEMLHIGKFD